MMEIVWGWSHLVMVSADDSDTEKDLTPLARANSENPWGPKRSVGSFTSGVSSRARGDSSPRLRGAYAEIQIKVILLTALMRPAANHCLSFVHSLWQVVKQNQDKCHAIVTIWYIHNTCMHGVIEAL